MQKAKTQNLKRQKKEEQCFHQNVQCLIVKNRDLSESKKPKGF